MTIYWRDYRIIRDTYQWILSVKTQPMNGKGGGNWKEFGYYHELSQLMAVVARHETGRMSGEIRLGEFIIMWNDILKGFAKEIEVVIEEVKEDAV